MFGYRTKVIFHYNIYEYETQDYINPVVIVWSNKKYGVV